MNSKVFTAILISIIFLSSCGNINKKSLDYSPDIPEYKTNLSDSCPSLNPVTPTPISSPISDNDIVYIGATETKYHYEDCWTLKGNGHPISMEKAIEQGYTSCKVCKR